MADDEGASPFLIHGLSSSLALAMPNPSPGAFQDPHIPVPCFLFSCLPLDAAVLVISISCPLAAPLSHPPVLALVLVLVSLSASP